MSRCRGRESFVEEFTDRQMVDAGLRGLTSGLDPESDFLDEEEMQSRQGENKHVYRAVPEDYRFAASNDDVLARLPR